MFKVVIKNKMHLGDEFEIITPDFNAFAKVVSIVNKDGDKTDIANTNDEVWMELDAKDDWQSQWQRALGRTLGIKNETET